MSFTNASIISPLYVHEHLSPRVKDTSSAYHFSLHTWPGSMVIEIPNHDNTNLELTQIVPGGTLRQARWMRSVVQTISNALGSETLPERKSFETDETDIAFGKVVEVVKPHADSRLAMQAGLDVLLNKLDENGVAQFFGIFTTDKRVIATFKAELGTVVPPIPSPWPRLPRTFPFPSDRDHNLRVETPTIYGDGWDLRHGVAALDEAVNFIQEQRGVKQVSVVIDTLDLHIMYYPGPSRDRTTTVTETSMFIVLRELVRQHGVVEADFQLLEVTSHLLGYGWIRFR